MIGNDIAVKIIYLHAPADKAIRKAPSHDILRDIFQYPLVNHMDIVKILVAGAIIQFNEPLKEIYTCAPAVGVGIKSI